MLAHCSGVQTGERLRAACDPGEPPADTPTPKNADSAKPRGGEVRVMSSPGAHPRPLRTGRVRCRPTAPRRPMARISDATRLARHLMPSPLVGTTDFYTVTVTGTVRAAGISR